MAELVDITTREGRFAYKLQEIDGLYMLSQIKDTKERFKQLKELKCKEGDVMIATYPKVGSHWLQHTVHMLKSGKPELYKGIDTNWLDFRTSLDEIDKKDGHRILTTSLYPKYLSEDFRANMKIVLGLRNPKDTAVSFFYQYKADPHENFALSWTDYIDLFSLGKVPWGSFFEYYRQWQEFITTHPDHVLPVYYEDMKKDYKKELRRIADFLGFPVSEDLLQQIAEKLNIKTVLKDLNEVMKDPDIQAYAKEVSKDGILPFYRKGIVGDWKNHFTVAQNKSFDSLIEKEMQGSIFKFEYSI